ncbi:chymotrypsin inhibitor-like isoform X2 [Bombus vancouverensis nearcticus]|uniref:chymotrypsin inhibitor-like isoform X2 n=1 Tax=Bombus vancouverensis nearcticus TaxID=2705178 RepID=UPI00402B2F52
MDLITTAFATLTLYLILATNRIFTAADETTESEPTKCGENEEYTTCNLCPKNCENPFQEICSPGPCIKACKCKSGYYKDSEGVCVSIIACIVDNIRNRIPQVTERSDSSSANTS